MAELSRRGLLRAAGLLPAAGAAGSAVGCARAGGLVPLRPAVRVAVPWSAGELEAFRRVVNGLDNGRGPREYSVDVVPLGDNIAAALGTGNTGGPDVVLLPRPGLVAEPEHLSDLEPLPRALAASWPYADIWDLLWHDSNPYGLPFKIAHKSAVWYRTDVFDRHGLGPPRTWSDWRDLNDELVGLGETPLALAGGDGWVLTDFFENVLLGSAAATYTELAVTPPPPRPWKSDAVRQALRLLGRMWSQKGVLAGDPRRCLALQFPDAVLDVFRYGRAAMVVAPDFAESIINRFGTDRSRAGVFPFPAVDGDEQDVVPGPRRRPLVVGGDVAVLVKPSNEHASDLVARLAKPSAPRPWIEAEGGFLAAHPETPGGRYSDELAELAKQLEQQGGEDAVAPSGFDLSDRIGAVGGRRGLWRVLQDFLAAVGEGSPGGVNAAADEAVTSLRAFEDRLTGNGPRGGHG